MRRSLPVAPAEPAPGVARGADLAALTDPGAQIPTARTGNVRTDSTGRSGRSCDTVENMSLKLEAQGTFHTSWARWGVCGSAAGAALPWPLSAPQKSCVGGNRNVTPFTPP